MPLNNNYDYSIHYRLWHDDSEEHIRLVIGFYLPQLKPYLPSPSSLPVLDIGCGMGFFMLALKEYGFTNVSGIDADHEQVNCCRKHDLVVEETDDIVHYLEKSPGTYEVILMFDILEHIPVNQQILTMRAVYNALRQNGRVILKVPNASSIVASRQRYIDYTHSCSFTEYSLSFVLKNAGFGDVQIPHSYISPRPPLRLWRREARRKFRSWLIRYLWKQVLIEFYGVWPPPPGVRYAPNEIYLESDLMAVATK